MKFAKIIIASVIPLYASRRVPTLRFAGTIVAFRIRSNCATHLVNQGKYVILGTVSLGNDSYTYKNILLDIRNRWLAASENRRREVIIGKHAGLFRRLRLLPDRPRAFRLPVELGAAAGDFELAKFRRLRGQHRVFQPTRRPIQ
jgi:hypothetical protein